jgi:hypothetical protein
MCSDSNTPHKTVSIGRTSPCQRSQGHRDDPDGRAILLDAIRDPGASLDRALRPDHHVQLDDRGHGVCTPFIDMAFICTTTSATDGAAALMRGDVFRTAWHVGRG